IRVIIRTLPHIRIPPILGVPMSLSLYNSEVMGASPPEKVFARTLFFHILYLKRNGVKSGVKTTPRKKAKADKPKILTTLMDIYVYDNTTKKSNQWPLVNFKIKKTPRGLSAPEVFNFFAYFI